MIRHSKVNEYYFELAGTSNYQSLNYRSPTVYSIAFMLIKLSLVY